MVDLVTTKPTSISEAARLEEESEALPLLSVITNEFVAWWREHRDGSPNATYRMVDRFVKAVEQLRLP